MTANGLNLAGRPFTNERPARRTTLLLWLLAMGLLALNITLYWNHLSNQQEQSQAMDLLERRIGEQRSTIADLQRRLERLDLRKENRQIEYLNAQIVRRAFSWSDLLDRVGEALPEAVLLRRISPSFVKDPGRRSRFPGVGKGELVAIDMGGVARTSEAVLSFVDALFEHSSFLSPNLATEKRQENGQHEFALTVLYLPESRPAVKSAAAPAPGASAKSSGSDESGPEPPAETPAATVVEGER